MAAKSLGTLLSDTIAFTKRRFVPVLLGAVVFGLLSASISWGFVGSQAGGWQRSMAPWMEKMNGNNARMQDLLQKMQNGNVSEGDMKELQAMGKDAVNAMPEPAAMKTMFASMLPSIGVAVLLGMLLGLIAKSYYTMIAVKDIGDTGKAVSATGGMLFPLIGLWIWLFLRSFVWIPFVGFIIAVIVGPRLVLSPLYLVEHKKGILESARMSYGATRGYWGKIIGNAIVAGICVAIVSMVASWIVGALVGMGASIFVMGIVSSFCSAVMIVFLIQLARTVMGNARKA